jgi:hypothetical protein
LAVGKRIAVIVPAHRGRETIGACLDALHSQTLDPELFEVLVVDTGEDDTAAIIEDRAANWDGRLHYATAPGTGPGQKRNLGAMQTDAEFLAFTDADCMPDSGWLAAGLRALESGATIVQGPTLTPDGEPPPAASRGIYVTGPSPLYESCNVMYEARAFRKAGGFPVDIFELVGAPMGEDTEAAWRVLRRGGSAVFEPQAVVRHVLRPPDFSSHLRYEWQARFFPLLVRRVPELRGELLVARTFLGRRSLETAPALAGLLLGSRRRWGYALCTPYLARVVAGGARAPSPALAVKEVATTVMADLVRECALVVGSVRYRSIVV